MEFIDESPFSLPNAPFHEEDMMQLTDITRPAALRTDLDPPKSITAYSLPRYKRGDKVLFTNPMNGLEAFGEIVSNSLTGLEAHRQPILRGENSLILYEVRITNSIANIRNEVKRFLQSRAKEELVLASDLRKRRADEVTDILHRQFLYLAVDITLKANIARKLRAEIDEISCANSIDKTDVAVLSESDLTSPKDRWEQLEALRLSLIEESLRSIFARLQQRIVQSVFLYWHDRAQIMTLMRIENSAVTIQSLGRMFLARQILRQLRENALQVERSKWLDVQRRFKFVDSSHPNAVTMDGKRFFETTAEANRFFVALKKVLFRCIFFMRRRYLELYQEVSCHTSSLHSFFKWF